MEISRFPVFCEEWKRLCCGFDAWSPQEWNNAFAWCEVDRLKAELQEARKENEEQARLLGMSGEREADLLGKADRLERELAEEQKKFAAALPPHDCVAAEERYLAAREVAIKYRTLWGELAEAFGTYAEMPKVVDAEIEAELASQSATLKERTNGQ